MIFVFQIYPKKNLVEFTSLFRVEFKAFFFRQNTQTKARELGLKGWVKNLDDGRVEAIFEGEKEKIEKMIEWLKKGPTLAKVTNLKAEWQKYQAEFDGFEIRYS